MAGSSPAMEFIGESNEAILFPVMAAKAAIHGNDQQAKCRGSPGSALGSHDVAQ
jgi:hypothetical protein